MTGAIHESAVARIRDRYANVQTKCFMRKVNRIVTQDGADPSRDKVTPDAYVILPSEKQFIAFEVEDHSKVTREKMERYAEVAWALDDVHWGLSLILVNRWGETIGTVDPLLFDIENIVREAKKRYRMPSAGWVDFVGALREMR